MKGFILALAFTLTGTAFAAKATFIPNPYHPDRPANCKLHKIYCKVMELQPLANPKWAMKFSNSLLRHAKKYNMDPWLSLAIAMQESSLLFPEPRTKAIAFTKTCDKKGQCKTSYQVITGHADLSIFQLHVNTILYHGIDPVRLKEDLDYATDWHYRILKKKIAQCKHLGNQAWGCYHSRTPHLHANYVKKVNRYYHGEGEPQKKNPPKEINKVAKLTKAIKQKISALQQSLKTTNKSPQSSP